jgi:hypothetical protein
MKELIRFEHYGKGTLPLKKPNFLALRFLK